MLARIVGIILGLILSTSGYVVAGWGSLGGWAANLDLGPFEPHRPFAGGAAAILGGVLLVAALTPRPKPKRRKAVVTGPMDIGGLELAPVLAEAEAPMVTPLAPAPRAEPTATPVLDLTPVAKPAPAPTPETFAQMRERMIAFSRAESWADAARTLMAMKAAAKGDHEQAIAYRDLGDFARGQGQLDDAAEAYETAVSFARDARRAAPNDAVALELLAGTLAGVGDVAEAEGPIGATITAHHLLYNPASGGREAQDPSAQRALSVSLERLADLREDRGHRMRALDLYRESYDVAARLAAADPARFGPDLALTRQRLAELEAKVAT